MQHLEQSGSLNRDEQMIHWAKTIGKRILPAPLATHLQQQRRRWQRRPPVGWVQFGSLRRLNPIDREFGAQWGHIIDRYYIEKFLEQHASDIHGRVLEVADDGYTRRFGGERVTRSDILHYSKDNPRATIVADLTNAPEIPSNAFDCIILTQTLQFIFDLGATVKTLRRILTPGGAVLVTCHGISQISQHDMEQWGEYWRFTSLSARRLFAQCFAPDSVEVQAYGNVLVATAFLHGLTVQELRREELDYHDPAYELIIGVRALKLPVD